MMMDILNILYNALASIECLLLLILISHYIFLEPCYGKRNSWIKLGVFHVVVFIILVIVSEPLNDLPSLTGFLTFALYSFTCRHSKRMLGLLRSVPIIGTMLSLLFIVESFTYALTIRSLSESRYLSFILDIILWILLIVFLLKGKNWRRQFEEEIVYMPDKNWEKYVLNGVGVFLLMLSLLLISLEESSLKEIYVRAIILFGGITMILLLIAMAIMVKQWRKKNYYMYTAEANQRFLKMELEHFRNYQQMESETRRMRHDMKNHILCMEALAEKNDYAGLKKYIDSLGQNIQAIDKGIQTGNPMADAICNEKAHVASKHGISINVQGQLSADITIEPTDLCAIFANALDNAIDYLSNSNSALEKKIGIKISSQGSMELITFENPVEDDLPIPAAGETSKDEKASHGFGTVNMIEAVRRYNGTLTRNVISDGTGSVFRLEIIIFG